MKAELKTYERSDPKLLEKFAEKKKVCNEAHVRWTDNLFTVESFLKKNQPGMDIEGFHEQFPVLKDLDYYEPWILTI